MKTNFNNYWNHYILINDSNFGFDISYKLNRKEGIYNYLSLFWKEVMNKLSKDVLVNVILKVQFEDLTVKSISYLQTINNQQFDELLEVLTEIINLRLENYSNKKVLKIIFTYHIKNNVNNLEKGGIENKPKINKPNITEKLPNFSYDRRAPY